MKTNAKKLLFVMLITVALIFSISLTGCSFGLFDIDIGIYSNEESQYFALGITARTFQKDFLGFGAEFEPNSMENGILVDIFALTASEGENDDPTAAFHTMQIDITKECVINYCCIAQGALDENLTVDYSIDIYGNQYHHKTNEDKEINKSPLNMVIGFFEFIANY